MRPGEGWQQGTAVHRCKFTDKPFRKERQHGLRPRAGLVHQGTSPLVVAPSWSPIQCYSCSCYSAWSKHSDSESTWVKCPAFIRRRIYRESTLNFECAYREGPIGHLWSQLEYISLQAKIMPTHSKDMFWTEGLGSWGFLLAPVKTCSQRHCGRGARQGPEASLLVSQGQITHPMNCSCADSLLIPCGSWTRC